MTTTTAAQDAQGAEVAAGATVTLWVTQTTAVVLQVDTIDLDAPEARTALERAVVDWLAPGGCDPDSDVLAGGLEVFPGDCWDLPLTVPVLDLPAGRDAGTGTALTWTRRTRSDSDALDALAVLAGSRHSAADLAALVYAVLAETGRPG